MDSLDSLEKILERSRPFSELRLQVIRSTGREVETRIKEGPAATDDERNMGCYAEDLEPQVRTAVLEIRRKGYNTYWSGFSTSLGEEYQTIEGYFLLQEDTIKSLENIGVSVEQHKVEQQPICRIYFLTDEPNLEKMKIKWEQVADILPDLGKMADPAKRYNTKLRI